jgi:predicted acyltransferase
MQTTPNLTQRLYSLDALRGFDMFWIIGGDRLVRSLGEATGSPFWIAFGEQLEHPYWNGFTAYDLIFPLFMFVAGVSVPYSIGRALEKGKSKSQIMWRVLTRGLILIVLGMVYNNGIEITPLDRFRFPSVLGKIGASYIFANIIYLYAGKRSRVLWYAGLLICYWLLLKFTSAPGFPAGDLTEPGNFMSYFDRTVLPGKLSRNIHDTVGLLNLITGTCTILAGIITGVYLKNSNDFPAKKVLWFLISGVGCIGLALLWNIDFPINKNLWSSSFVLLTTGLSLLLLAIFYFIIDVQGYKRWTLFFRVIGMNSILIYLSWRFINWDYTAKAFFTWLLQVVGKPYDAAVLAACAIIIEWLFLYFLYRKKVFLKV